MNIFDEIEFSEVESCFNLFGLFIFAFHGLAEGSNAYPPMEYPRIFEGIQINLSRYHIWRFEHSNFRLLNSKFL